MTRRPAARSPRVIASERTKAALAERRRQGVRLGRPRTVGDWIVAWAVDRRQEGATLQMIADELTAKGAATARGGRWWPSTVAGLLRSHQLDAFRERQRAEREKETT